MRTLATTTSPRHHQLHQSTSTTHHLRASRRGRRPRVARWVDMDALGGAAVGMMPAEATNESPNDGACGRGSCSSGGGCVGNWPGHAWCAFAAARLVAHLLMASVRLLYGSAVPGSMPVHELLALLAAPVRGSKRAAVTSTHGASAARGARPRSGRRQSPACAPRGRDVQQGCGERAAPRAALHAPCCGCAVLSRSALRRTRHAVPH